MQRYFRKLLLKRLKVHGGEAYWSCIVHCLKRPGELFCTESCAAMLPPQSACVNGSPVSYLLQALQVCSEAGQQWHLEHSHVGGAGMQPPEERPESE